MGSEGDPSVAVWVVALALGGVAAGLWLLVRGMGGYRTATRVGGISTSPVATMAAGEVRVSGIVEPAEVLLVSPLQSEPCVYYRSEIRSGGDRTTFEADFLEERAIGFQVRDSSGTIRIFPNGARWDAPKRFDGSNGSYGDAPPGLRVRTGSAVTAAEPDRETAIAALLSVQPAGTVAALVGAGGGSLFGRSTSTGRGRRYEEMRLAPGDTVTIIGRALPFGDLADPAEADFALGGEVAHDDPEVLGDLAEARAAGLLADSPEQAWGNAAIPGFGIGRPVRAPVLDPAAQAPALAAPHDAERFERQFHIAPETLVLASAPGVPLLIAHGAPGDAVERHNDRFLVGLGGALLAIASAVVLALALGGAFGALGS